MVILFLFFTSRILMNFCERKEFIKKLILICSQHSPRCYFADMGSRSDTWRTISHRSKCAVSGAIDMDGNDRPAQTHHSWSSFYVLVIALLAGLSLLPSTGFR
jgi:hypothetical protein